MSRTLASIQRITDIQPIPDADSIEVATVLGWKVVVRKGEFQPGDLAVYMEIDSVPPDQPEYRFLWKDAEVRPNNYRLRTVKLRGQISQGILFPLGPVYGTGGHEGDDITEAIGVSKYEPPLPHAAWDIEGQFFDGVPKTDEERVQSATGAQHLAALQGRPYYITEKCDGASMTVALHDGVPKVASRNYRLADREGSRYWFAARKSGLISLVETYPDVAVQGELVGPGIQGNRLGLTEVECQVFDVYDRMSGRYVPLSDILSLGREFGFRTVPVVERGDEFSYDQDQLLALAEGKYADTKNEREGIVIRSADEIRTSFKVISNRFLLKGGD